MEDSSHYLTQLACIKVFCEGNPNERIYKGFKSHYSNKGKIGKTDVV